MTRRDSTLCFFTTALLLLIGVLLLSSPTFAQDPIPTSADPSSAEQETLDLEVTVTGDNFGKDSVVEFLVSGTEDPGGIKVKKVKQQGPKTLKVTVDVEATAVVDDFDIRVMSRGRTGKGTELFRVLEKEHPTQDTTPPGEPIDLHALEVSYSSVTLAWTMPADDNYDATSGSVKNCVYWEPAEAAFNHFNHCLGDPGVNEQPWPAPGEEQVCIMNLLEPETTYLYRVTCADDSGNWSSEAQFEVSTASFSEFQDPSWTIEEVPIPVDALVGHGFDIEGNVVIGGVVGLWDQVGGGTKVVPTVIRMIKGVPSETAGWLWSYEDMPGLAGRLLIDPQGRPVFEERIIRDLDNRIRDLVYTFHDGSEWRKEIVATEPGLRFPSGFAFDLDGNPAIAWCSQDEPGGIRLARRGAGGQWTVEQVNQEECTDAVRSAGLAFDPAGRPAITYRIEPEQLPGAVKMTLWSGESWHEETLCSDPLCPSSPIGFFAPVVIFDPNWGDFTAVADDWLSWTVGFDRVGSGEWQQTETIFGQLGQQGFISDFIGQNVWLGSNVLEIDPSGELVLAHGAENGAGVALSRRFAGQSGWAQYDVDHPSTRSLPSPHDGLNGGGPFVALDPSGSPTLTWHWNVGGEPASEYHLYFAWQDSTPIVCGDGICNGTEDSCSCSQDCGAALSTELGLCADFSDNDCDTYIDCDDSDCNLDPACPYCGNTYCDASESSCSCPADCGEPPATEQICSDGIDNDCDTFVDCDDLDCSDDESCASQGGLPGDACTTGADCLSGLCHPVKLTCK